MLARIAGAAGPAVVPTSRAGAAPRPGPGGSNCRKHCCRAEGQGPWQHGFGGSVKGPHGGILRACKAPGFAWGTHVVAMRAGERMALVRMGMPYLSTGEEHTLHAYRPPFAADGLSLTHLTCAGGRCSCSPGAAAGARHRLPPVASQAVDASGCFRWAQFVTPHLPRLQCSRGQSSSVMPPSGTRTCMPALHAYPHVEGHPCAGPPALVGAGAQPRACLA